MQSFDAGSTVRLGNHTLNEAEVAAGTPPRKPFLGADGVTPTDPDTVRIWLLAPTGVQRSFSYPTVQPEDSGAVQKEETGRFYVDWTPDAPEDGLWRWTLAGGMGTVPPIKGQTDNKVFYVMRPVAGLA